MVKIALLKPYIMPLAMVIGAVAYRPLHHIAFLTPYLIFSMLFFTYLKMDIRKIKVRKAHFLLLAFQLLVCLGCYFLLYHWDTTIAQGMAICLLAPTATAAPVIVGMLRGDVESVLTYSFLNNMTILLTAPLFLSLIGGYRQIDFLPSVIEISQHTVPLLLLPFLAAMIVARWVSPKVKKSAYIGQLSFGLWAIALTIVTARMVQFITQQDEKMYLIELYLAWMALLACLMQFGVGRWIGKRYDNAIACTQGLGQKNTILAIWLAQTYLYPMASVAPGFYVIWQNIINSYQIWHKRKKTASQSKA